MAASMIVSTRLVVTSAHVNSVTNCIRTKKRARPLVVEFWTQLPLLMAPFNRPASQRSILQIKNVSRVLKVQLRVLFLKHFCCFRRRVGNPCE